MLKTSKIYVTTSNVVNFINVEDIKDTCIMYVILILAIRTVARGHKLVAKGWASFEKTCSEVGMGELPQLLQYVKTATTPTPTGTPMTPVKIEGEEEEEMDTQLSTSEETGVIYEKQIHVTVGGRPNSTNVPTAISPQKHLTSMDSHIHAVHTKKALVCSFCGFSTYNMDSLQRHEKEHK